MKNIVFIEIDTQKEIGSVEHVRDYLKLERVRLKAFERYLSYYKDHGWYGGFNSDLYTINLQAK